MNRLIPPRELGLFSVAANAGTECAGCGRYEPYRKEGPWLCTGCIVNGTGLTGELQTLRQDYLDRFDPKRGG